MADVATDSYAIYYHWHNGNSHDAKLMIFLLILSTILQLATVAAVHFKNKKQMVHEMFLTLTYLKPAKNFFRVLTDAKMEGHEIASPMNEVSTTRERSEPATPCASCD